MRLSIKVLIHCYVFFLYCARVILTSSASSPLSERSSILSIDTNSVSKDDSSTFSQSCRRSNATYNADDQHIKFSKKKFSSPFLKDVLKLRGATRDYFAVRQVPGDGSCLFHSISVWLSHKLKFSPTTVPNSTDMVQNINRETGRRYFRNSVKADFK